MSELISVKKMSKKFRNVDGTEKLVLSEISLTIHDNEIVGIMGKSGCGKTTLLKIMGLLEHVSGGDVLIKGKSVRKMEEEEKRKIRREVIGFVFQDYRLLDSLTVEDNILLPLLMDGKEKINSYERVYEIGKTMGIMDLMKQYPQTLSGGEKQRAAICRALINDPDVILADEPTGNLDVEYRKTVMDTFRDIRDSFQKAIVIVTHDPEVAACCDRVVQLGKQEL